MSLIYAMFRAERRSPTVLIIFVDSDRKGDKFVSPQVAAISKPVHYWELLLVSPPMSLGSDSAKVFSLTTFMVVRKTSCLARLEPGLASLHHVPH